MINFLDELKSRDTKFRHNMDKFHPGWEIAVFFHRLDIFYFTGTLQNGVYIVPRGDNSLFFVRRNFDRAKIECPLNHLYPMESFEDLTKYIKPNWKEMYINKINTPINIFETFNKYFKYEKLLGLSRTYYFTRSIKSKYELKLQKKSGNILKNALVDAAPELIKEGMSEWELGIKLFNYMVDRGHEFITRMNNFNAEMFLGTISFSENACYFSTHDGPAGLMGLSNSSPFLGSKERKLRKGDIIVIDMVCNNRGYHTDKTIIYSFGKADKLLEKYHNKCLEIEKTIAEKLIPGRKPEEIYIETMNKLDNDFLNNFMGYKSNQVKFLGHGIGLTVDEYPVIAKGFKIPLEENMTLAIEPKKSIGKNCMVGSENTYLVSKIGGISLTGKRKKIISI
jgi:Xaa-Pro aminopeptidase